MGANTPERRRSPVMTWLTPRAPSMSAGDPPTKSGSAIGMGWTLPCVTSRRSAASARRARSAEAVIAAPNTSARRLSNRRGKVGPFSIMMFRSLGSGPRRSAAEHVLRVEIDLDILPGLVFCHRKEIERRTGADRTQRALRRHLEERAGAAVEHLRLGRERPVLPQQDVHLHIEILRVGGTGRQRRALRQASAQGIELVLRQPRRGAGAGAQRSGRIERVAGGGLTLRRALVEERQPLLDLLGIKLGLRLRRLLLRDRNLGLFLLWLGLLYGVLLERLGDRVGRWLRLLFRLVRLRLGARLRHRGGLRLRQLRFGRSFRHQRRGGHDFRLVDG